MIIHFRLWQIQWFYQSFQLIFRRNRNCIEIAKRIQRQKCRWIVVMRKYVTTYQDLNMLTAFTEWGISWKVVFKFFWNSMCRTFLPAVPYLPSQMLSRRYGTAGRNLINRSCSKYICWKIKYSLDYLKLDFYTHLAHASLHAQTYQAVVPNLQSKVKLSN